jgi:hemerythrin-like domain-containing protein
MKAIDDLLAEHDAVRLTLKILSKATQGIDAADAVPNADHLEQLFDFFRVFVDRCHHGKEEELLFPALEQAGISREGGPVGVMLKEHQEGRDLVAGMASALSRHRGGDPTAARKLKELAAAYVALLDRHIEKENTVLFPMASDLLSDSRLEELKKGFDRIETEKIGPGKHEAFHAMIDALEKQYLK